VELFRVFDWDGSSLGRVEGGPLFVARSRQGAGRHDGPAQYGAWYCSQHAVAAVAECIQYLRGHALDDGDFVRGGGRVKALVTLRLDPGVALVNLDDPAELLPRRIRPSQVATMRRPVTQHIAASVFREGAGGLLWWSTLEAEWINVTLFHERALPHVVIGAPPRALSTRLSEVREAAEHLGVAI
jgi:hypothetical protein